MKISEWKKYRKRSKYNARKVVYKGIKFDSQAECDYYCGLELLKKAGEVVKIELQPKFLLQPGYKKDGKKIRPIYYIADFRVTYSDGHVEIVDCKGWDKRGRWDSRTPVYKLKRKMLHYKYPDLTIVEA